MAKQILDLGATVNDGTGDPIRNGGEKINFNFDEIYTLLGTGTALTTGLSATSSVVTLIGPTITGVATFAAGTDAAPAITTSGDSNTGIYFSAADEVAITTAGTQRLRIDNTTATFAGAITGGGLLTTGGNVVIPDAGTIGSASSTSAMTIASTGIVTFADDIIIKDSGTIGSTTTPGAITIASDGDVAITGDLTVDTDTLYVDSTNNRVGIGTVTPSVPLHVAADSNTLSLRISGRSADDRSDIEFYENDNTTKLTSLTNEQTYSLWSYGTRSIYTDSDTHIFRNGSATTLARIDSDGLKFNSDTAAANALDDYEEGTWTPSLTFGGGSTGMSYGAQSGYYTKIGNIVYSTMYISLTAKGSSTGDAEIGGLPFTSNSASFSLAAGSISFNGISFADFPMIVLINNSTSLSLRELTNAGGFSYLNDTNFINTSNMVFTTIYRT